MSSKPKATYDPRVEARYLPGTHGCREVEGWWKVCGCLSRAEAERIAELLAHKADFLAFRARSF